MTGVAISSLTWTFGTSLPNRFDSAQPTLDRKETSTSGKETGVSVVELQQLAQIQLRRPLHDAPPLPVPMTKPLPPLDIRLTGTIVEPGHCRAMIQLADGSVKLKGVGEMAGSARIVDIKEGSVTVDYLGKSVVLNVIKDNGS